MSKILWVPKRVNDEPLPNPWLEYRELIITLAFLLLGGWLVLNYQLSAMKHEASYFQERCTSSGDGEKNNS